jgi:hypothetical protein
MRWTEFQEAGLLETFWREGSAYCPDATCGRLLDASMVPTKAGPFDELNLKCPGCGQFVSFTEENDGRRAVYRDWTQPERDAMLQAALDDEPVFCPVDGAKCEVKFNVAVRGIAVPTPGTAVACYRCGREFIQPH